MKEWLNELNEWMDEREVRGAAPRRDGRTEWSFSLRFLLLLSHGQKEGLDKSVGEADD